MDKPHHNHSLTRRERRTAARKNQILDAAISLFAEKGYHRTTTKDIADTADVSEGTIYNYFDHKEDLLIGIIGRLTHTDHDLEDDPLATQESSREYLQSLIERRLAFIQKNYPTLRAVLSEILVNPEMATRYYQQNVFPVQLQIEEDLKRKVERGEIREIDPVVAARILVAAIFGLFFLETMGDPSISGSEKFGTILIDILFEGIQIGESNR